MYDSNYKLIFKKYYKLKIKGSKYDLKKYLM